MYNQGLERTLESRKMVREGRIFMYEILYNIFVYEILQNEFM